MSTGDAVWVRRPEEKYQWRIMSDTEMSLWFHLNEGEHFDQLRNDRSLRTTLLCFTYKTEVWTDSLNLQSPGSKHSKKDSRPGKMSAFCT